MHSYVPFLAMDFNYFRGLIIVEGLSCNVLNENQNQMLHHFPNDK
jgi:hypothetical protein